MDFMTWHLLAILSIIVLSFIAGYGYASISFTRYRKTVDSITNVKYNLHRRD
ncbi:uncharacterized protein METZ01_LOCUS177722 [marine metagenome]|jgi:hypothetical protein|uniref:Uncharacterized protein n=1 Tax=marine metagenome TaxID=408172 RepID=A0A382CF98_9ZZZZ